MKTSYVVGFAFTVDEDRLLLIKKNRPDWQRGKLNGIGGHIEPGELPLRAMVREFRAECGINTSAADWKTLCFLQTDEWVVYFYAAFIDTAAARDMTDEPLYRINPQDLPKNIISNLKWLIPLALYLRKFPKESLRVYQ